MSFTLNESLHGVWILNQYFCDYFDCHGPYLRQEDRGGDSVTYIQSKNICMDNVADKI